MLVSVQFYMGISAQESSLQYSVLYAQNYVDLLALVADTMYVSEL